VLNGGNLVLLGSRSWGKIDVSRQPSLSAPDAVTAIERYLNSRRSPASPAGGGSPR